MATKKKLLEAAAGSAGGGAGLNVEEVFSTYVHTGTGAAKSINNGIDLSGEGGLVWSKARSSPYNHGLIDTERGVNKDLRSNSTNGEASRTGTSATLTAFNSDGFSLGQDAASDAFNRSGVDYASWTFRKAPKFFTCLTYTGSGSAQNISHDLGSVPGCIIIKNISNAADWTVYHRGVDSTSPEDYNLALNKTDSRDDNAAYFNDTAPTSTVFTVNSDSTTNTNGDTYVAYLFAHNDGDGEFGPDGDADIIKCGSYTGNGSTDGPEIDLGFEPQWLLVKNATNSGNSWGLLDVMRGLPVGSNESYLFAQANWAESSTVGNFIEPTSTGFRVANSGTFLNGNGSTIIYIAIRRGPMAVPTDATDVFGIATRDATPPAFNTSFDVDMSIYQSNVTSPDDNFNSARLMQGDVLKTNTTDNAISGGTGFVYDYSRGWYGSTSANSNAYSWMWGRAPNFFDVVCNTAVASSDLRIKHNLGVEPEMIWTKQRSAPTYTDGWYCYHKDIGTTGYIRLDLSSAKNSVVTLFNSPSSTDFGLDVNAVWDPGTTFVHYLFASLAGVSKVGSYTGNGSTQTIDCGFSSGARFVLIKGLTVATPWLLYDSTRGIVSGNDPYITLDAKSGNSTTDYIDPDSSGFIVNNNAYVNNNGSDYIFYAIA